MLTLNHIVCFVCLTMSFLNQLSHCRSPRRLATIEDERCQLDGRIFGILAIEGMRNESTKVQDQTRTKNHCN